MNELISVIVPVYMVEKYLDRCVKSIVNQTYRNLDIILVDDGSPDYSGKMCDLWAEKDERIHVIHQKNGGLSAARNVGIKASKGKYLLFVDSDDYIADNMIKLLYKEILRTGAEISICNFLYVDENADTITELNDKYRPGKREVLSGTDFLKILVYRGGPYYSVAWNKLYKKELFSNIQYPLGKIHEDDFIVHHLFGACSKIASISDYCYYYVQRDGSIMSSRGVKASLDALEAFLDRAVYIQKKGMKNRAGTIYYDVGMKLNNIHERCLADKDINIQFEQVFKVYRKNIYLCNRCSIKQKVQIALFCINPHVFRKIQQII